MVYTGLTPWSCSVLPFVFVPELHEEMKSWNTYNIIYGTSRQSRFNAWYWMLGASALGWPRGMVWGGKREEDSGWGTHVYLWQIHFDIWQNQYNIVKFKNKIKCKRKKRNNNNKILKKLKKNEIMCVGISVLQCFLVLSDLSLKFYSPFVH